MHGLSPEEEIDYWRERARRAEAELAHEREMTAARKIVHRAARNVDRAEDLATIQRESARVNEQGGVIAHLVGVLAEVMRATTVENARTFAEIALSNIEAWHAGAWTPGPSDDAADWKPGHHREPKETPMTPPLTDAELDHRAEVARLDGNYLALELIRELRAARAAALSPADVEALGDARAAVKLYRRIENTAMTQAEHDRAVALLDRLMDAARSEP